MKYKDFKQMSIAEMKNVKGGFAPGEGGTCKSVCTHWNASTMTMDNGTCTKGSQTVGNTTAITCDCSLSSGSSCYNV